MNFFENQEMARRKSALLLFYFLCAVVLIALAVNLILWAALRFGDLHRQSLWAWMQGDQAWQIAGATLLVIAAGSFFQLVKLRSGGEAVAKMVGAREVPLSAKDPLERRYINVVEEMAIAAGVTLPRLYIMDREAGINAFVAGYQPNQAVMVVTKGALEQLDRDQLQGVVGHEFSHILNGDMRLNVRLLAILAGILLIGQIGEFLLRSTSRRRSSRSNNKSAPALLLGGLGLMAVGYIGLFFGRLIKAAVSRQREFLADASSVQFTRNPDGIAGALNRIRESSEGSLLLSTLHAEDMNHLCFEETVQLRFRGLFASHPPLEERIRAIDPLFLTKSRLQKNQQQVREQRQASQGPVAAPLASGFAATTAPLARALVAHVGQPQPAHYEFAQQLKASWPAALLEQAHTPGGAAAILSAILIADMGLAEQAQGRALAAGSAQVDPQALEWALDHLGELGQASRLPIIDICLGSLKALSTEEKQAVLQLSETLVQVDQRFTLFEWTTLTLLKQQLQPGANRARGVRFKSYGPVSADICRLFAVLARVAGQDKVALQQTCQRFLKQFTSEVAAVPPHCSLSEFSASLHRLAGLAPLLKQPLLESCVDIVLLDGQVKLAEYELIRAIAEILECPMPPLLPTEKSD